MNPLRRLLFGTGRLLLAFDAAKLAPDRSGLVEVRPRMAGAERAVVAIGGPTGAGAAR